MKLKRNINDLKNIFEKYIEKNGTIEDFNSDKENYLDIKNNIEKNENIIKENLRILKESYVNNADSKETIDECINDTEQFLKNMKETKDLIREIENFIIKNNITIESEENYNNDNSNNQEKIDFQLKAVKLTNNKEFLQNREKELTEINKLSQNIKAVSDTMKINVFKQGEDLNSITEKVNEMDSNVDKADKEITKAKNMDKKTNRKICFIFIFVILVIIVLVLLFLKIIK
jgi:t-SNARE complex subunit (syntaxin)